MRDQEIVALYWSRSELAIEETARKYGDYCNSLVHSILENQLDCEECVSDAYLRLWNTIPPQRPKNLKVFLAKITRNLAFDRLDRRNAIRRGEGEKSLPLEELRPYIPAPANMEQVMNQMVLRETLDKFLRGLQPEARKIFMQRYWYSTDIEEIAAEHSISESAVRMSLYRSRKKLKAMLEEEEIYV